MAKKLDSQSPAPIIDQTIYGWTVNGLHALSQVSVVEETRILGQSMAVLHEDSNTENAKLHIENYKNGLIPQITLASVESLTLPLVQEIVLLADFGCKGCP